MIVNSDILQQKAMDAAAFAYAPYSKFRVGSALLCANGQIITGCNIENLSFGLTNCGERTAIFTAISKGLTTFTAMAIYSPQATSYLVPCGACRQVLSEFVKDDFPIYMGYGLGSFICKSFGLLMPYSFKEQLHQQ